MTFVVDKFKHLQKLRKIEEKYDENAPVIAKGVKYVKPDKHKPTHSFQHLIGKKYKVKQLNLPKFDDGSKPRNTYPITEEDRVRMLIRNGAKEKTFLDD